MTIRPRFSYSGYKQTNKQGVKTLGNLRRSVTELSECTPTIFWVSDVLV